MPPRPIPARPAEKPKMFDRVTAWAYAFTVIQSISKDPLPPGAAAIAAAILTVGNVDIQDPMLANVVELMSDPDKVAPQHEGHTNGNGS